MFLVNITLVGYKDHVYLFVKWHSWFMNEIDSRDDVCVNDTL
jgi:hypothetical protein